MHSTPILRLLLCMVLFGPEIAPAQERRFDVPVLSDEADAVLAILALPAETRGRPGPEWERLRASEGYRRLQARELSLGRGFEDSTFRAFVLSPELAGRAALLRRTLESWKRLDVRHAARRAFAYLPESATLHAKIYPVIKPQTNSFVFEPKTDPAIFLYLDPGVSAAELENILAHELHHIGVGSACRGEPADTLLAESYRTMTAWMGGFAEGLAVLAAAGGPDIHPHATSDSTERAVWDWDMAHAARDLDRLERFFLALLEGALPEDEAMTEGMRFINSDEVPQGAFYTLGWLMGATVEREFGRERLIATLCDPPRFLAEYAQAAARENRVRARPLPVWSEEFLGRMTAAGGR